MHSVRHSSVSNLVPAGFLCIGLLLVLQHIFLRLMADQFLYEISPYNYPVWPFVISQIAAGAVFLNLLWLIPRISPTRLAIILMLVLGLALRLLLFGTTPILEVDFYRYLWDGAVITQGFNPYLLSPEIVQLQPPGEMSLLVTEAGYVFDRINYPELKTIYPGLTQMAFAFANWIDGWNLDAWRLVLLASEIASITLLLVLLREFKRSPMWVTLYWWNPLVTKELFNSAHMDALLVPFLLAAIILMIRRRFVLSSGTLALAAGIKLWPLLLLPFSLRPLITYPRQLLSALALVSLILALVLGPLFIYGLDDQSGLLEYSQNWIRNSGLFSLILGSISYLFQPLEFIDPGILARILVALLLATLAIYLNRQIITDRESLIRRMVWLIVALFMLSPAQFPWYTIWFAPLLCIYPQRGLLLLSVLMPIYYLWFYYAQRNEVGLFDGFIVWMQYLPVFALLLYDFSRPATIRRYLPRHV